MLQNKLFYLFKPLLPRRLQIGARRWFIQRKLQQVRHIWPVLETAGNTPTQWQGWPEGKKFALILTHDVELDIGHDRCKELAALEQDLGVRSSFNFVPKRYKVSEEQIADLKADGFEVGVHGLSHDGKLYFSQKIFNERAVEINKYIKKWNAVGFRSPAMHHNLDWIHKLNIKYDASTFDVDPFEPQSDGVGTIFPFIIPGQDGSDGYVELPYTVAQDFTLFILMKEKNINLWKQKVDWIVEKGGMILVNTHPDYMYFGRGKKRITEFPVERYLELIQYIKEKYAGQYWHALPQDVADFVMTRGYHE